MAVIRTDSYSDALKSQSVLIENEPRAEGSSVPNYGSIPGCSADEKLLPSQTRCTQGCAEAGPCMCCPFRVLYTVAVAGCCSCCTRRPDGVNRLYELVRRVIREGVKSLPVSNACWARMFTDLPVPTCTVCCRCLFGVPGGMNNKYQTICTDSESRLKGRWVYSVRAVPPIRFLREASSDDIRQSRWVLFLHGGGFNACKPWSYSHFLRLLSASLRAYVLAPHYRRAPEHPHPAAIDDCFATYQWLLRSGVPADRIVVVGDSAGGGLVSLLLSRIADTPLGSMPSGAVMISPWVDLRDYHSDSWSVERGGGRDFINARFCKQFAVNYAGDPPAASASATNGNFEGFPPVLVESGQDEVFCSQIAAYTAKLEKAGVVCQHNEIPSAVHVASIFYNTGAPVSSSSCARIIAFLEQRLSDAVEDSSKESSDDTEDTCVKDSSAVVEVEEPLIANEETGVAGNPQQGLHLPH